jgi:hypothetical protein
MLSRGGGEAEPAARPAPMREGERLTADETMDETQTRKQTSERSTLRSTHESETYSAAHGHAM